MSDTGATSSRRRRIRPIDAALWGWWGLAMLFLALPIVATIGYSFNAGVGGRQTADFTGWSLDGYAQAAADGSLRAAAETSIVVALVVTVLALLLGGALGYETVRHPRRAVRRTLAGFTYLLLIVPETVLGVTLLLTYTVTHVPLGIVPLILGHTPLSIAVVAFVIRARTLTLDPALEEAAADLGSGRVQTLRRIVVPQLGPALVSAALLAYVFSFDNVVISNFLSTATLSTLPVYLYGSLQYGASPAVWAVATVLFVITAVAILVALALMRAVLGSGLRVARGRAAS